MVVNNCLGLWNCNLAASLVTVVDRIYGFAAWQKRCQVDMSHLKFAFTTTWQKRNNSGEKYDYKGGMYFHACP